MSEQTLEREQKLEGVGASRKRKEDARFIRGQGSYVDDSAPRRREGVFMI